MTHAERELLLRVSGVLTRMVREDAKLGRQGVERPAATTLDVPDVADLWADRTAKLIDMVKREAEQARREGTHG
jgi:hypothetical protein